MVSLADSMISSSSRPVRLRARADLTAERQRYQGRVYWVVKDPVGLNYFRFQEEEFSILHMVDGKTSLDEIKHRFEKQFPPQKITVEELDRLIGMLHRSNLVVSDVPGQGPELRRRGSERQRKELTAKLTNILAIRFKGIDPDRILTWLYPWVRWMFSTWAISICLVMMLCAVSLVTVQWDLFQSKLPTFNQFFASSNWFWLAITLSLTKVIHEFGHGLSCKHFGGECHEMGVMFLVLTPCLYCNVSDSWMLPNKWHRAAIGAAGMYIEVTIASIATFVWWFSEPGLLHYLALNVMFISSVSTILFNANPLLRYDGYYILSDIAEIPNLRQKSTAVLSRKLGEWCLGIEPPPDPFLPERNHLFFATYNIAASIYRWVIVLSILWFLNKVFEPYNLQIIGQLIALASIYGLAVMPLWKLYKFFHVPGRIEKVKPVRMYATAAVLAIIFAAIFFVPLPFRVFGKFELQAHNAQRVFVEVPGVLKTVHDVRQGQQVKTGQKLITLDSVDLRLAKEKLEGQRAQQESKLDFLSIQSVRSEEALSQLQSVEEVLKSIEVQLQKRNEQLEKLVITSPSDGVILPPPSRPSTDNQTGELPTWDGTPLQNKNKFSFLTDDVMICQIGDPCDLEAVIAIDQSDIPFVHPGQDVELFLAQLPGQRLHSTIRDISKERMEYSPHRLSGKAGGEMATKTDATGMERPITTSYPASAPVQDENGLILVGTTGTAKIDAGYQTIARRLWRYLSKTFNFDL